jgi:hypothetical protein
MEHDYNFIMIYRILELLIFVLLKPPSSGHRSPILDIFKYYVYTITTLP